MEPSSWVFAGLGNPGARYAGTRHDLGFALVERLAHAWGLTWSTTDPVLSLAGPHRVSRSGAEGESGEELAWLAKPLAYMNRSGPPLQALLEERELSTSRLIVACDDLNIPLGTLRLRSGGSSGGHNGLRSVEAALATQDYGRLRLGVGPLPVDVDQADWVLAPFEPEERIGSDDMLQRAMGLLHEVLTRGCLQPTTSKPEPPAEDSDDD
ncbi:MAG: aminoacyl-tRNA hydrolase [Acidobacteriota bacterium]